MLNAEDIFVQFDQTVVLQGVDLNLKKGEIVGLIGQNGCGKTTFLNAVSGFVNTNAGSIIFNDEDVTSLPAYKRARSGIGRSFQNPGVFKEMTLEENLMLTIEKSEKYPWWWKFSKSHREKMDKKIDDALNDVELHGHKHSLAGVLSGGQLRLLELTRLKLAGGRLLLIDEPTAGVSPVMKKILANTIKDLGKDKDRTILIVEHDLKFLFGIVDRVIVLVEGRVYMEGKPDEIVKDKKLQEVYFGA